MKPTISIIIPVYNRASLVIRTLDSIAAQTLQPDRIIVVDNNSSDGSYDAVKRWMDAYSGTARCTLLTERKPGAAAARNKGLREADSEIVAFFDSDDTMRPDFVRHIINSFDSETDTDILCWKALEHLRDGSTRFKKFNRHADFEFHIFHSFLYTLGFAGRRSLITAAGGWDESLSTWDDWGAWHKNTARPAEHKDCNDRQWWTYICRKSPSPGRLTIHGETKRTRHRPC